MKRELLIDLNKFVKKEFKNLKFQIASGGTTPENVEEKDKGEYLDIAILKDGKLMQSTIFLYNNIFDSDFVKKMGSIIRGQIRELFQPESKKLDINNPVKYIII